jgi:phosphoadenosine phosphosulfate reductase
MRVTARTLAPLNDRFRNAPPLEILRFARAVFGERAAILSSMQRAGTALCHLADRAGLGFDVLFVDTGVLHPQTLETRDALVASHPNLRVVTLSPRRTMAAQIAAEGVLYLSREGQERCCELRKSVPLLGVKGRYDALVGALRRDEGGERAAVEPFGLDPDMGALRVHPFASLTTAALDAYLAAHPDVVVNPLHAMGFPTVGCFPCTSPVLPDEPERAGRWRHLASVQYCGINPVDGDGGEGGGAVEIPDRYASLLG